MSSTSASHPKVDRVALVLIGRNEGERLVAALESVQGLGLGAIIYVDSGSEDESVAHAKAAGALVEQLDLSIPFTAARARNAGASRLSEVETPIDYIQFIDGDCCLVPGWLDAALAALEANPKLAVVCGRRLERYPEASFYNRMCDIEWNTPVGPAQACGGDAMMRRSAFEAVGGFNPTVIAGEEPELCFRLRQADWAIERLGYDMTAHDAAITQFSQWWRRAKRSGYATCLGVMMHGKSAERYAVRPLARMLFWGGLWVGALVLSLALPIAALLLFLYPVQLLRMSARTTEGLSGYTEQFSYACYLMLGQFAETVGVFECVKDSVFAKERHIIEYK